MEKHRLALTSFLIAVAMTLLKIGAGWFSGSLGVLSDAAHSAVDSMAVFLTYLAVRVASKPADTEHTYGHGKIESLAALVQTGVLLLACFWILSEALQRILFKEARIHAGWWTFGVMALSIVVNFSRSRALARGARTYSSPALEADAAHFSVDLITDIMVILGLVLARVGEACAIPRLAQTADGVAAIGIAAITLHFSLRLGRRAFDTLMDRAPVGVVELVRQDVATMEGVLDAHRVRVRRSGATIFVDLHVSVARNLSSERSHEITLLVEKRIHEIVPHSEVLVHVDPVSTDRETPQDRIRLVARNHARTVHNVHVYQEKNRLHADLHLEVSDRLDIRRAHAEASKLESWLRRELPDIASFHIHIEGRGNEVEAGEDVTGKEARLVEAVKRLVSCHPEVLDAHNIHVRAIGGRPCIFLHCAFADEAPIARVHEVSTQIEDELRLEFPHLGRIVLHAEPGGRKTGP